MASFNKVVIMGNLTRTPELRSTPGGTQVTDITLAINDVFTGKDGQKQERVNYVDITVWGKSAETLARWKKQGDPLLVEGRLQQDKWVDKESGKNRSKLKVICTGFTFVGSAKGNDSGNNQNSGNSGGGNSAGGNQRNYDNGPGGYDDYATSHEEPPF